MGGGGGGGVNTESEDVDVRAKEGSEAVMCTVCVLLWCCCCHLMPNICLSVASSVMRDWATTSHAKPLLIFCDVLLFCINVM